MPTRTIRGVIISGAVGAGLSPLFASRAAHAQETPTIRDRAPYSAPAEPAEERPVAIEVNPASLLVARIGGAVEVVPTAHHGLIVSGAYVLTKSDIATPNASTTFRGGAFEVGYRYYSAPAGPRGFFIGPSFMFGTYTATPDVGDAVSFKSYGGAVDVGYQVVFLDRVVIGLGAGVQYTRPSNRDLPEQQTFSAGTIAQSGIRPRVLFALGIAI